MHLFVFIYVCTYVIIHTCVCVCVCVCACVCVCVCMQEALGRLLCRTPISAILIAGADAGRGEARASTAPSAMEEAHAGGMGQDVGGEGGNITQRLLPTLLL